MGKDRSYLERNRVDLERLRVLGSRLTDEVLARPLGNGWTVAATLAHVAFWEQNVAERLRTWERLGIDSGERLTEWQRRNYPGDDWWQQLNDDNLKRWLTTPPRQALEQALAWAAVCDQVVADLPDVLADAILEAGRLRVVDRSVHRREHLDEVERAMAADDQ